MKAIRLAVVLTVGGSLGLPPSASAHGPEKLDPQVPVERADQAAPLDATSNIRFVKNIPYVNGSDVEFGRFTVRRLDENGEPICERDAAGECVLDANGQVIYQTEVRHYAFAGSQNQGERIVDITDPENAFVAATISCRVNQSDIQVREDLGLLVIGVDTDTSQCGLDDTKGLLIFDVKDPRFPTQLGVFEHARGAHNVTLHPVQPLAYISDSDLANAGLGEIPIVDLSNPAAPALASTFKFHGHSPHDISFNAAGTRAYTSSISHSDILNTSDPRNPVLITSIHDPSINIHHQSDPTPDGRYLIVGDELAGAAAGPQCPGGGLHVFDITNEQAPRKVGVFFAKDGERRALCTAHVFRINPDGRTLTVGWYSAGTRVVDISNPANLGTAELGHMIPSGLGGNAAVANSWASKMYRGYIYSNDRSRGLDIMQWDPPKPASPSSDAVVAFIDTGINPYHQVFRDTSPRALQHPSTYLPGYPADAEALPITLTEPDWAKAVKKDCATVWKNVVPGKLYWFPGTKIVGAVSFNPPVSPNCTSSPSATEILDSNGHGTMVASRAASTTYGACRECLVVSVQMPTSVSLLNPASSQPPAISAIRFAANNAAWIDAQSNSWGPIVFPGWEPTGQAGLLTANPELVRTVEEVSQKHLAFWASGNGAAGRGGVIGSPTLLTPSLTPSAISVGGLDSGYVNTWPGFPPHVVSDSCYSWAAYPNSTTASAENVGGGTSGATPFVAGGAARILMEARGILGDTRTGVRAGVVAEGQAGLVPSGPLADGIFTMAEWRELTFKTASPRPRRTFEDGSVCTNTILYDATPLQWEDVPPGYPEFLHIGYGAVDDDSRAKAFRVLRGDEPMPDRTVTDAYFAADGAARSALHQVYRGPM